MSNIVTFVTGTNSFTHTCSYLGTHCTNSSEKYVHVYISQLYIYSAVLGMMIITVYHL